MPIKGVSDVLRLPRLGKLRLGIMVEETPEKKAHPQAVDYFVCPPEVQEVFGPEPREIEIMFPVENPDEFAQQFYRAYSLTQGLICIGDGISRRQKVDTTTKKHADHNTQDWEWVVGEVCDPQECDLYAKKHCRRVLNLQFLLPQCPGLGVWQIDTTSFYSIVNINSMIALVKNLCGRISMVPLTLCLGPIEVTPKGMKKKTVYVMHIKQDIRLADLQQLALTPASQILLPQPEVDEAPSDLYPEVIEGKGEVIEGEPQGESPAEPPPAVLDQEWKRVRGLQKELDLPDEVIKSQVRLDYPDLKAAVQGALPETPPPWLTPEIARNLRERLETTVKARQKKSPGVGAGAVVTEGEGEAPPEDNTQARRIAGWALIRELQKKLNMEDIPIKSAFKHQFPELKSQIPRSALRDQVPDWATLEHIIAMASRLQGYQQKVASLNAELPVGPPASSTAPPLEGDHPWDQAKRGEDLEPGGEQHRLEGREQPPPGEPEKEEIDF